jgi:hypothetical protein
MLNVEEFMDLKNMKVGETLVTGFDEKLVKKAAKEILEAFKKGQVPAAAEAYEPYKALKHALKAELAGKIPLMLLERFLR